MSTIIILLFRSNEGQEHGVKVVEYYQQNSTIQEFQKLWRARFVEVMSPKHMGDYWHVDYDHLDYLWVKTDNGIKKTGTCDDDSIEGYSEQET